MAEPVTLLADAYLREWLDLLLRWLHVVAGIVWIGTSFYFVALDSHLRRPKEDTGGVAGESWEIHGGGFYRVQKYRVAPEALPEPLHWFKWEAYTTWLSGFALLVVLYYLDADTYLVDRSVADLGVGWAVAISVGLLALAWILYDVLCRILGSRQLLLAVALLVLVAAAAYGVGNLFSARAAPIQLGAMLGTMMAGNVLFVIIPGQRELVRAKRAAREPDPEHGIRGKQRSVHNNYLTLPVVLAMIAPHFPFVYTHERAWLVLLALMVLSAWLRHFFNLRHGGRTVWAIPVTAAVALVALAVAIRPEDSSSEAGGPPVEFARVATIVEQRCATCHSVEPTDQSFSTAPKGV
ncbi:MAG: urate hydroxylase PuuD, partial [Gaiellaceae bacterium]